MTLLVVFVSLCLCDCIPFNCRNINLRWSTGYTSYSVHAEFASSPPPSSFVGIVSSGFNTLKIRTLLVHAGLFGCFHNPTNSDMNHRSFKAAYVIFLRACTQGGPRGFISLIRRTFVEQAHIDSSSWFPTEEFPLHSRCQF